MNILTDKLPTSITVGGVVYEIETDYRAAVQLSLMVERGEKNPLKLCKPFFPKGFPKEIDGAVKAVLFFFRGGDEVKAETKAPQKPKDDKPAYSFDVDKEAIYADFWRYYNIDLSKDSLHWWTFKSLLMGLPEKSNFKDRIYYRKVKLSDLPKGERKRIAAIRKEIEIRPHNNGGKISLEQRNQNMIDYVKKRSEEVR